MIGHVGIDTIRVTLATMDGRSRSFRLPQSRGRVIRRGCNVDVEASLPRRFWGHNGEGLPIRLLEHAVTDLIEEVNAFVPLAAGSDDLRRLAVQRVDLVRDFHGVGNTSHLLAGLLEVPRSTGVVRAAFGRAEATQTLSVGTGSWKAVLYDKTTQRTKPSHHGDLRYELRLRKRRLTQRWAVTNGGSVTVVADLDVEKVDALAWGGFRDAAFNTAVGGSTWERLQRDRSLSEHQRVTMMGYDQLCQRGYAPALSRNTLSTYRRLMRDLPQGDGAIALDWTSGTVKGTR